MRSASLLASSSACARSSSPRIANSSARCSVHEPLKPSSPLLSHQRVKLSVHCRARGQSPALQQPSTRPQ